jgi:hypothetical protein
MKGAAMVPQFIRVCVREREEVYIRLSSISKIEVRYAMLGENRKAYECSRKRGMTDPSAVRVYTIFAAGQKYTLAANPGSRTMQVLEELCKNAIKDD